jgi:hypothetical protein
MAKKGQAAMEFLMTYGWAILVVLIAIGALVYFGVTRPQSMLPQKCTISTGSGLYCAEFSTTADAAAGTITLRLKNVLTDQITVTEVTLDDPITVANPDCTAAGGTIDPDDTADFAMTCGALVTGDKIKGNIVVSYSVGAAGLSKSTTGELQTLV